MSHDLWAWGRLVQSLKKVFIFFFLFPEREVLEEEGWEPCGEISSLLFKGKSLTFKCKSVFALT